MTEAIATITNEADSAAAGAELGRAIRSGLKGEPADAVVVFASALHDYERLLSALADTSGTEVIVGASSAGEFAGARRRDGGVSAMGLRSTSMRFSVGCGREVARDPAAAARELARGFQGLSGGPMPYRTALVMTDALAGHADAVVEELTIATGGNYRFFGGGAGDDARFHRTHVFQGTQARSNAVVALEILSSQPVGVGVSHGWTPAGPGLRVTEVEGYRLVGLNGMPAVQAFDDHAEATGQTFDHDDPLPFFLHNILGIESAGSYRLRVPLGVNADGSIECAAGIPEGAVVSIMKTTAASSVEAARNAARAALDTRAGQRPSAALVFDCVATRLRMGRTFDDELEACARLLEPVDFIGCNTYGQIARAEGQFGGFHNCTAVVCVLPE